ncbi:MAG: hypothetical protein BIFFINMI_02349 [Phycisphaerae bacterium]|nr:hypothetical protein [Phycisphaerae bacterium]
MTIRGFCRRAILPTLACLAMLTASALADTVEMDDGRVLNGKVIDQTESRVTFMVDYGGGVTSKTMLSREHIVKLTIGDAPAPQPPAHEPAEQPGDGGDEPVTKHDPAPVKPEPPVTPTTPPTGTRGRTQADVLAEIDKAGKTPPAWWNDVQLVVPQGLDLTWQKPQGWNASKYISQYIWDIINPNQSRWQEGVKLLHHVVATNKNDSAKLRQSAAAVAGMYQRLLCDWARAAWWWQKTRELGALNGGETEQLAECYFKLGSRQMAVDLLNRSPFYTTRGIKLWASMGDVDKALQLVKRMADDYSRNPGDEVAAASAAYAYVIGGDVCRGAGRIPQAVDFYNKVLSVKPIGKRAGGINGSHARAQGNLDAIRLFDNFDLSKVPDGAYRNHHRGYAGEVEIEVVVKAGRIESVKVVDHHEKQYYASIANTTQRIVEKQSVRGIDTTAGATITCDAIINATAKALAEAKRN